MRLSTFRRWLKTGWVWGLALITLTSSAQAVEVAVRSAMGDLSEFQNPPANWQVAGGVNGDLRQTSAFTTVEGSGLWVNQPDDSAHGDLISTWTHGDLIVEFDYLLPVGATATISFQGRYEVELTNDRASGLWQHARLEFTAPRIDPSGETSTTAQLVSLEIDGIKVRENIIWLQPDFPTESTIIGPLVIDGDRGPLALRHFAVQHLTSDQVALKNLHYAVYQGTFDALDDYRHESPTLSGATEEINETLADTTDAFAMVVTGEIVIPKAGWYRFTRKTEAISQTRLLIDGASPVAVGTDGEESQIRLTQGTHPFRLDYLRPGERGKPLLAWSVTGPDMRWQPLSFSAANPPNPIPIVPVTIEKGRVHTHRCFFPYQDNKRLYVAAVGTPQHVHYAYDLEWQNLLAVWRGDYLDASGIWHQRGGIQQVVPLGPAIELGSGPSLAVLESPDAAWPDPEAEARQAAGDDFVSDDNGSGPPTALINLPSPLVSKGYTLAPDGQPTFQFEAYGIAVEDRWEVTPGKEGLIRTLRFAQPLERDDLHLLLASESEITAQSGYYILGDRKAYLDWPDDQHFTPTIHSAGPNQQLRVHLPAGTQSITYRLIW